MNRLIFAILLGLGNTAVAGPRVYKLDLEFKYLLHNAEPMNFAIEHDDWTTGWAVTSGIEWGYWFLEPEFHFESAYSKVMTGGLHFETGWRVNKYMDFSWEHHSRHYFDDIDGIQDSRKYPLWDSVNLKFKFVP